METRPNNSQLITVAPLTPGLTPGQIEMVAGLSAGTISTLVFHPLDLVKTRLQVHRISSSTPITTFTIFSGLIYNKTPVQSLYRGLSPNLLGNAGSWSIFFSIKSVIEDQIVKFHIWSSNNVSSSSNYAKNKSRDLLTPFDFFLASAISGMMITLSTNPIWVLKTRMLSFDRGKEGAYKNIWHGSKQIFRREGFLGFYKGTSIGLLATSHGAVQFSVYEPVKKVWKKHLARAHDSNDKNLQDIKLSIMATLTISGSAKMIAGIVTYPLQVVRSRLQVSNLESNYGNGILGVTSSLWREQGWRGFYKGLGINITRVLPATWVTFLVYENVKYYLTTFR